MRLKPMAKNTIALRASLISLMRKAGIGDSMICRKGAAGAFMAN